MYATSIQLGESPKGKTLECLICSTPINHAHLGIDACRACAVFYKRHATFRKPLICRRGTNDCYEKNSKPFCRKCRFVKFASVLGQPFSEEELSKIPHSTDSESSAEGMSSGSPEGEERPRFLDHRSFSLWPSSSSSESPFFDKLKRAYSMMCCVRKCGEFGTLPFKLTSEEEVEIIRDDIKFFPSRYPMKIPNGRIFFAALIQFADTCFEDFRRMSAESKHYIVNICYRMLSQIDAAYRSMHHFPDEETMVSGYMSYFNAANIVAYVESCPHAMRKEEVIDELTRNWSKTMDMKTNTIKRVNPTDEEFVAMLGLALWNNDVASLSDDHLEIVERNRGEIMRELHKLYARQGLANYAMRLGELLMLMVTVEKTMAAIEEDLQVYKLMNLFNEDFGKLRC